MIPEKKPDILIVDDDLNLAFLVKSALGDKFNITNVNNVSSALETVKNKNFDLILLDIEIGDDNGLEAIKPLKNASSFSEIIMLTGSSRVQDVVKAIQAGAADYVNKPFEVDELKMAIYKALEKIKMENRITALTDGIDRLRKFEALVYKSEIMQKVVDTIKKVAPLESTVLIKGESGTGKELVANAIHCNSQRKDGPFIAVNCASIPDNLFEAEMFGFEKGSFTSAIQTKKGKFEIAHGGTIFLDELASLRENGQASLLRAIERKEIERVGSTKKISVDIRIIAATNRDLQGMIKEGKFRKDLFYRLNVIPIEIPPLSERKMDIEALVEHFINKYNFRLGKNIAGMEEDALKILKNYDFPGNVRELENLIERLVALGSDDVKIKIDDFPLEIVVPENPMIEEDESINLEAGKRRFEKELIIAALDRVNWNRTLTAKMLGIHINTLLKKMNDLKIIPPPGKK